MHLVRRHISPGYSVNQLVADSINEVNIVRPRKVQVETRPQITVIIIVDSESSVLQDIIDVVSGKTARVLKSVEHETESVLRQAQTIDTNPPQS